MSWKETGNKKMVFFLFKDKDGMGCCTALSKSTLEDKVEIKEKCWKTVNMIRYCLVVARPVQ